MEAGIEWLGLTSHLQVLGQLPCLEDRLNPTHKSGNLSPELGIGLSGLEKVQKLLADQGNRVPGIRPLVRTGLCQSLRPIPVLVPSLLLEPFPFRLNRNGSSSS